MLRLADIPSARAERSLYLVNEVLADFRSESSHWPQPSREAGEVAKDSLLRLVTIAEMFASEHLIELAETRLPTDELVLRLWDERIRRILRDWGSRRSGWKEIFELDWTYKAWPELFGFITARNIVVHGLGQLTRFHVRRGIITKGVTQQLTDAGLSLRGRELLIGPTDVERCAQRVKHFIAWLDEASRIATLP